MSAAQGRPGRSRISAVRIAGHDALRISNGIIAAEVLPSLGAKIWTLTHLESQVQWIWHRPGVALRPATRASVYDDEWAGGWEELFPNDAPGEFGTASLTDHGEWWRLGWQETRHSETDGSATIELTAKGDTVEATYEKIIRLERGSHSLVVDYRIRNDGVSPLIGLFKQHLPVKIGPRHQVELPGGKVVPVDPKTGTLVGAHGPHRWPLAVSPTGEAVDLRRVPDAASGARDFVYVSEVPEGWCGVRDEASGHSIRLHYPLHVLPFTWLFMTYGGWRGLYTVVLEPCTNMPKDLAQAHQLGQSLVLNPGSSFECSVRAELT